MWEGAERYGKGEAVGVEGMLLAGMLQVVRVLLEPGSISLLLLALSAGALVHRQRWGRRVGTIWTGMWCAAYLALSLPAVAARMVSGLSVFPPLTATDVVAAGTPVVVLAGGGAAYNFGGDTVPVMSSATTLRILEAARVQRLFDAPFIVVAGTQATERNRLDGTVPRAMHRGLMAAGVPEKRIVVEAASTTTYESAQKVRALLAERGVTAIVLVTSATHMRRAVPAFEASGMRVVAAPAPVMSASRNRWWQLWIPSLTAWSLSATCLHEYVGLLYYRMSGRA